MKQKIVIQMPMCNGKCRSKAMQIASNAKGRVNSVAVEGDDRDRVVVIGEEVDAVCLATALRKKFKVHTTIISVEQVKDEKKDEKKEEEKPPEWWPPYPYSRYVFCEPCHDETNCTIM